MWLPTPGSNILIPSIQIVLWYFLASIKWNWCFSEFIFSLLILLIETVDWEFFLLDSDIPWVAPRELLFKLIRWVGWKPLFGARVPPFVRVIFVFFNYFAWPMNILKIPVPWDWLFWWWIVLWIVFGSSKVPSSTFSSLGGRVC